MHRRSALLCALMVALVLCHGADAKKKKEKGRGGRGGGGGRPQPSKPFIPAGPCDDGMGGDAGLDLRPSKKGAAKWVVPLVDQGEWGTERAAGTVCMPMHYGGAAHRWWLGQLAVARQCIHAVGGTLSTSSPFPVYGPHAASTSNRRCPPAAAAARHPFVPACSRQRRRHPG